MRAVDQATQIALDTAARDGIGLPYAAVGPVREVFFGTTDIRDIAHELGVVPDGYHVLLSVGGSVLAADVHRWTDRVCWLQASDANTRIRVVFFKLQERVVTNA